MYKYFCKKCKCRYDLTHPNAELAYKCRECGGELKHSDGLETDLINNLQDKLKKVEADLSSNRRVFMSCGLPCACRFDENDDETHTCELHKGIQARLTKAEAVITALEEQPLEYLPFGIRLALHEWRKK